MISRLNTKKLSNGCKLKEVLASTTAELEKNKTISNAQKEAELILEHTLKIKNCDIVAYRDHILGAQKLKSIKKIVTRRLLGTPLQYIFKKATFCNNDLHVNKNVLIPRAESEIIVNRASDYCNKKCLAPKKYLLLDIGTGSGAIAIAICKKTKKNINVLASDISPQALNVARKNIATHKLLNRVTIVRSNLLANIDKVPHIIVANLPYVKEKNARGLADPKLALVGGKNGYELIFNLLEQIKEKKYDKKTRVVFLEIGHNQARVIKKYATVLFPKAKITSKNDLAGYNRLITIEY